MFLISYYISLLRLHITIQDYLKSRYLLYHTGGQIAKTKLIVCLEFSEASFYHLLLVIYFLLFSNGFPLVLCLFFILLLLYLLVCFGVGYTWWCLRLTPVGTQVIIWVVGTELAIASQSPHPL